MSNARKLALSAILSALGVALMFAGSVAQVLDLTGAAVASVIVIYAVIELGGVWPYLIFAVTGGLALLLLPDKFAAVAYVLFIGYYPIVKSAAERKLPRIAAWILKFALLNAALTGIIAAMRFLFHSAETEISFTPLVYALCNVAFLVYDIALTRLISFYYARLQKRFRFKK